MQCLCNSLDWLSNAPLRSNFHPLTGSIPRLGVRVDEWNGILYTRVCLHELFTLHRSFEGVVVSPGALRGHQHRLGCHNSLVLSLVGWQGVPRMDKKCLRWSRDILLPTRPRTHIEDGRRGRIAQLCSVTFSKRRRFIYTHKWFWKRLVSDRMLAISVLCYAHARSLALLSKYRESYIFPIPQSFLCLCLPDSPCSC